MGKILLMVGFVILGIISWSGITNEYLEEKSRPCTVLAKMTGLEHHKYSATNNWILILETGGKEFDLKVSPTTYWRAEIGKVLYFNLSDEDIEHNGKWVLMHVLGVLGMFVSCVGFLLALLIYLKILK